MAYVFFCHIFKVIIYFQLDQEYLIWTYLIDLYFLILPVIAQIFSPIAELVIPTGIPTKEKKAEIETHPIIVEAKKRNFSI